jgi:hypothetical protein
MMDRLKIKTLCGSGSVPLARRCLSSLVRASTLPIELIIHNDGSLSASDKEGLREVIPNVCFFDRSNSDEHASRHLSAYPSCAAFRGKNPLAHKLFDLLWSCEEDQVLYLDTDVLFFRRFAWSWENIPRSVEAVFMRDHQSAYSLRPMDPLLMGIPVAAKVNTGFFAFRKSIVDLEFLEWFLSHRLTARGLFPMWLEQTCWAILAGRSRSHYWNPAEFIIPQKGLNHCDHPIAAHFVSPIRKYLPELPDRLEDAAPTVLIPGATIPRTGILEMGIEAMQRYQSRRGNLTR